jgi:hypothetical protein
MVEPEEKDIWSTGEMLVEVEVPAEEPAGVETPVSEPEASLPEAEPAETEAGLVEGQETEPSAMPQSAAQQLLNSIEEARLLRESIIKINEDFHTHILPADEPIRDEEPPFVLEEQEQVTVSVGEVPVEEHSPAPIGDVSVPEEMVAPMEEISVPEPTQEQPPAAEPLPPAPTPAPAPAVTAEPVMIFEPYHTIDYFASQGIRLTLDENPSDQLGKQLKSFTDWLRVMRRLPQKEKEIIPDRVAEQAVQSIAAHSIEGKEVLTETMAEVLAMQGMPERARIVYEKLSLLNPGKSAYFAAKIEQLNSH